MLRRLWPFTLGSAALGLDAYVMAGLLSDIAKDLHTSESFAAMGVTAFTGSYALSGPFLAGRMGRRARRSLVIAMLIFVAANLLTAWSPSIAVFLVARAVAGAAAGLYSPLSSAVAAAAAPTQQRGRALSLVLSGLAVGTVFGVPLGLAIARTTTWRASILLVTAIGALALLGVTVTRPGGIPDVPGSNFTTSIRVIVQPRNLLTATVTLLTAIASLGLYTFIGRALSGTGLPQEAAIWIWGTGGAIGAILVGRLLDRVQPAHLSLGILLVLTLAFVGVMAGQPVWMLAAAVFTWGFLGWASLAPQQHILLSTNPENGAAAVAANSSANYFGAALGSAIGAALIAVAPSGAVLAGFSALVTLVASVMQAVRVRLGASPSS